MTAHPVCGDCGRQLVSWGVRCLVCGQAQLVEQWRAASAIDRDTRRVAIFAARDWPINSEFQHRRIVELVAALRDENTTPAGTPTLVTFNTSPTETVAARVWNHAQLPVEQHDPRETMRVPLLCTLDAAVIVRLDANQLLTQIQQLQLCRVPVTRWHA